MFCSLQYLESAHDVVAAAGIGHAERSDLVQAGIAGVHRPDNGSNRALRERAGQVFQNPLRVDQG